MAASLTHSNSQATADVRGLLAPADSPSWKTPRTENQILRVLPSDSWEQLEEQMPAWEAVLDHNRSLSIFSTAQWLGSWWKAFRSSKRPSILAFAGADNSMAGLLPGYLEEFRSPFFTRLVVANDAKLRPPTRECRECRECGAERERVRVSE